MNEESLPQSSSHGEPATTGTSGGHSVLYDPWARQEWIPLNGWFERHSFHPILLAVIVSITLFLLFQVVGAAFTLLLLRLQGVGMVSPDEAPQLISALDPVLLLLGNGIGQVLGFAIPVLLIAGLHSRRRFGFLRLRSADMHLLALSAVGLIALIPVVQWSATLNELIPLPDSIQQFEQMQMELIERVLLGSTGIVPNLVLLAVIPAICEELLFRGYLQRQTERVLGAFWGIIVVGIAFGLYHMRLSQVLPLCILGLYLGYVVWRSGSLWPGVVVHFLNNGIAVFIGAYVAGRGEVDYATVESISVPWYVAIAGAIVVIMIITAMNRRAELLLHAKKIPKNPL